MARKSIIEATSQIMGQKEINHLADDRGPNDLEQLHSPPDSSAAPLLARGGCASRLACQH